MAKTDKLYDVSAIQLVGSKEKPKGIVFTEWDILFAENVSEKKRELIIERLLKKVVKYKVKDQTVTTALKYQNFKSETNDNLYVLRVYRNFKKAPKIPVTRKSSTSSKTSGKPADAAATLDLGPIRTPGPPVPKLPAGVVSISNTVGLSEDSSG